MAISLKKLATPVLAASLLLPSLGAFAGTVATDPFNNGKPSALAMMTDLIIIRPVGAVLTAVGAAAYVASLPFTLPTGSANEAGSVLFMEPATYTFARCLGCTRPGYHPSVGQDNDSAEAVTK
ncbi:MAG: hypothetical protein R3E63_10615 [Pseudomonadales bacterium]